MKFLHESRRFDRPWRTTVSRRVLALAAGLMILPLGLGTASAEDGYLGNDSVTVDMSALGGLGSDGPSMGAISTVPYASGILMMPNGRAPQSRFTPPGGQSGSQVAAPSGYSNFETVVIGSDGNTEEMPMPDQMPQSRLEVAAPSAAPILRPPVEAAAKPAPAPTPAPRVAAVAEPAPEPPATTSLMAPPPAPVAPPPAPVVAPPAPPKPIAKPAPTPVETKVAEAPKAEPAPPEPKAEPAPPPAPTVEAPKPPAPPPAPKAAAPPPPPPAEVKEVAPATEAPKVEPTQTASIPKADADTAAVSPDTLSILFSPDGTKLSAADKEALRNIAMAVKGKDDVRLQLMAYAGGGDLSPSRARRLSLSRALAVRSFLIDSGVRSTNIDVRALGDKTDDGKPNRVDVVTGAR